MGKELILMATALSNEKGVDQDVIIEAIQSALESATRKKHGAHMAVRVDLDKETGIEHKNIGKIQKIQKSQIFKIT